jgi:hypothetical protein
LRISIRIIFGSWSQIRTRVKSWIRIRIEIKIQKLQRLKIEPRTLTITMEAWWLKIKPLRLYRQVVADSHHFEEELDPDLDPDPQSEKLDPDLDPH